MRHRWLLLVPIVGGLLLAGSYLALRGLGLLEGRTVAEVKQVPAGHQEIAWVAPATSSDVWERLIAALRHVAREWPSRHPEQPPLQVSFDQAFLQLTADVPEIALSLPGTTDVKLWIRWYKLTSEIDSRQWFAKLARRWPPPLAIIGGDTSDRALDQALALRYLRGQWRGADPLYLLTTATADRFHPVPTEQLQDPSALELVEDVRALKLLGASTVGMLHGPGYGAPLLATTALFPGRPGNVPRLIEVYQGHSFRFSFTNKHMVATMVDFLKKHPEVCPDFNSQPTVLAGAVTLADPWASLARLAAAGHFRPFLLYTVAWKDDRYSVDLAERFAKGFRETFPAAPDSPFQSTILSTVVRYSVGDYYQPNLREVMAVDTYLNDRDVYPDYHHLLVVPTGSQRARRLLRTLSRRAPHEVRNLVALSGDAIAFNQIYRDRDIAWNILDIPINLMFFSHRNPIDPAAGFGREEGREGREVAGGGGRVAGGGKDGQVEEVDFFPPPTTHHPPPAAATTSTQDLLLFADMVEALLQSAYQDGRLLADTAQLGQRLRQARWHNGRVVNALLQPAAAAGLPLFDADGDRHPLTGEHVVWLKPTIEGKRLLPQATITVWSIRAAHEGWQRRGQPLLVSYDRSFAKE